MNENGDLIDFNSRDFIDSNIMNKVINISLIILLVGLFIITEFGPPMSMF